MRNILIVTLCSVSVLLAGEATPSAWALAGGSFLSGILLTFTPCVLPMVPIVSAIIAGQGQELSKTKGFLLAFAYVLGTAWTYTVMGALAGATGEQLQAYFQNVWAIGAMSLVFVLMALSLFGLYTLQVPPTIQSKIDAFSRRFKGGAFVPVFIIGALSALILGACVSPVLISFLGVAIATHDAALGALTMFALAMGMGVPLLLVGIGAGSVLPKAGAWMDEVKHAMGVLLLAVAIYLFSELGLVNELLLWGLFLLVLSVYLGAFDALAPETGGYARAKKAVGVVAAVWGIVYLVGAAQGNDDTLQPLHTATVAVNAKEAQHSDWPFKEATNMQMLKRLRFEAKKAGKPMLIYFYSDTCRLCRKMKATTWQDPKVRQRLRGDFVAVSVNITDHSNRNAQAMKRAYKVFGTPAFIFIDEEGDRVDEEPLYGYLAPDEMLQTFALVK